MIARMLIGAAMAATLTLSTTSDAAASHRGKIVHHAHFSRAKARELSAITRHCQVVQLQTRRDIDYLVAHADKMVRLVDGRAPVPQLAAQVACVDRLRNSVHSTLQRLMTLRRDHRLKNACRVLGEMQSSLAQLAVLTQPVAAPPAFRQPLGWQDRGFRNGGFQDGVFQDRGFRGQPGFTPRDRGFNPGFVPNDRGFDPGFAPRDRGFRSGRQIPGFSTPGRLNFGPRLDSHDLRHRNPHRRALQFQLGRLSFGFNL